MLMTFKNTIDLTLLHNVNAFMFIICICSLIVYFMFNLNVLIYFVFLTNFGDCIKECSSTLYVGLQHAVPPTNTKFKPLLLSIQVGICYTLHKRLQAQNIKVQVYTHISLAKRWKSISEAPQNRKFL